MNRAGELSAAELEQLMVIVANPRTFKIPDWFLNRQKDHKDGKNSQLTSSALDTKLREDLERLKKIRCLLKPACITTHLIAPTIEVLCAPEVKSFDPRCCLGCVLCS